MLDLSTLVPPEVWSAVLAVFDKWSLKRLVDREFMAKVRVRTRGDGVVVTATDGWTLVEIAWTTDGQETPYLDALVSLPNAIACARGKAVDYESRSATEYPETDVIIRPSGTSNTWDEVGVTYGMNAHLVTLPSRVGERLGFDQGGGWVVTHGATALQPVIWWNKARPACLDVDSRVETCVVIMPRRID